MNVLVFSGAVHVCVCVTVIIVIVCLGPKVAVFDAERAMEDALKLGINTVGDMVEHISSSLSQSQRGGSDFFLYIYIYT